jgi:DNA-binding transcriptional MerR regulator
MFTIGQVARKFGLSRSTLIYYDKIGLLEPSGRSESNYRLYTRDDLRKMDRIMLFRSAGLSLEVIGDVLQRQGGDFAASFEQRLFVINEEIQGLRNQQKLILKVLKNKELAPNTRVLTKQTWISILRATGLDEEGMRNWHIEFEKTSPEAHQDFLESIGIEAEEIGLIREWSRLDNPNT